MASVLIIGGGVAGLAAAVELADAGRRVTLLEQRSFCGGRAYSFREPGSGDTVDNGQHLMMGCYRTTFAYLAKIGAADGVGRCATLRVPFADADGRRRALACPGWPPPWHLLAGLWRLRGFSRRSLWRLARGWRTVSDDRPASYEADDRLTAAEWLVAMGQDAAARELFWTPLILAVCNESPDRASAAPLLAAMRESFARNGEGGAAIAFPRRGLSELFVDPAIAYLRARGATVRLAATVEAILRRPGGVMGVRLRGGEELTAETYISAVPPRPLHRLLAAGGPLPSGWERLAEWEGVPILSVHLWFDRPVLDEPMLGFIGSRFQWAFNKSGANHCVALVISAAREEAAWPRERVVSEATEAVRRYLPAARDARIVHAQVTKELEATVSIARGTAPLRLRTATPWNNFFLAGDWTQTQLPATIEGAIRSGYAAAKAVRKYRSAEVPECRSP